jgi:hypothetical protein
MKETDFANADLFLYALYRLGGAGRYVDVEDVFMEMWRLAPARLNWRTQPIANYKIASKALVDIGQRGDSDLLLGGGNHRQLTAKGVDWVRSHLTQFDAMANGDQPPPADRRPGQRAAVEIERSDIAREFMIKGAVELERTSVAQLLRCSPDAPRRVWRERLETLRSAAKDGERHDLLKFLDYLEHTRADWFGGAV